MRELSSAEFKDIESRIDRVLAGFVSRENELHRMDALRPMGKLQEAAERIARLKAKHNDLTDELLAKVDDVETKTPLAFAKAHAVIDNERADIDAMASELSQLSNQ